MKNIHSYNRRIVQDLNHVDARSYLSVVYRTVRCVQCGPVVEELPLIDEIAIRKGHTYLTTVADWDQGRIRWVGEGRKHETLKEFFGSLSVEQKDSLWAIAMDMWDPYIKAVKECCPHLKIVFD